MKSWVLIGFLLLAPWVQPLQACGPCGSEWLFEFRKRAANIDSLNKGELGIINPGYDLYTQYVIFRQLAGLGEFPRRVDSTSSSLDPAIATWLDSRKAIPGLGPISADSIIPFKPSSRYSFVENCHSDAFLNASRIVQERIQRFGSQDAYLLAWAKRQDLLFQACSCPDEKVFADLRQAHAEYANVRFYVGTNSSGLSLEQLENACKLSVAEVEQATIPQNEPFLSDYQYQQAAESFYRGDFQQAIERFQKIVANKNSPLATLAHYMKARTYIRWGWSAEPEDFLKYFAQAEGELNSLLANQESQSYWQAARKLLNLVDFYAKPDRHRARMAEILSRSVNTEDLSLAFEDYRRLYKSVNLDTKELESETLSLWLLLLRIQDDPQIKRRALDTWSKRGGDLWLSVALVHVSAEIARAEPERVSEFLKATEKLSVSAPLFAHAAYHRVRILFLLGRQQEAFVLIDSWLHDSTLSDAAWRNALKSLAFENSQTREQFIRYVSRTAVGELQLCDSLESELSEEQKKNLSPMLDQSGLDVLNRRMPLSELYSLAQSDQLPGAIQRSISLVGWVRAFLLNKPELFAQFGSLVASNFPSLESDVSKILRVSNWPEQKFLMALFVLRAPWLNPLFISSGTALELHHTPYGDLFKASLDSGFFSGAWWPDLAQELSSPAVSRAESDQAFTQWTKQFEEINRAETQELLEHGSATDIVASIVLDWVKQRPQDSRNPEALGTLVRMTRYQKSAFCSCEDCQRAEYSPQYSEQRKKVNWLQQVQRSCRLCSVDYSKRAYLMLQRNFPTSDWALRTKFWFHDANSLPN